MIDDLRISKPFGCLSFFLHIRRQSATVCKFVFFLDKRVYFVGSLPQLYIVATVAVVSGQSANSGQRSAYIAGH